MLFMMQFNDFLGVGLHAECGNGNALLLRDSDDFTHCGITPRTWTRRIVFDPTCSGVDLGKSTFIVPPVPLFCQKANKK